jgi:AAA family ATP:ADP antiporter
MMGIVALPFYLTLLFSMKNMEQSKTLLLAVYVGLLQNVLSKVETLFSCQMTILQATKYALFDPTKEMAYIPLSSESKSTGKAAIDVLCARLGKSFGAFLQQILVVFYGSITKAVPVISFLFYSVIYLWIGRFPVSLF